MYKIPLFDVEFDEREVQAVAETVRSGWISMGKNVQEVETKMAERLGGVHVVAVSSCTAGLHLALLASGIGPGDEVLVPSLTFVATVNAIRYVGAKPVFVDIISLDEPTLSIEDAQRKVTEKTRAIMPVHYAGFPSRIDAITELARHYELKVIEDCAHTPDVSYKEKKLGTWGDFGCFSFFANKIITSAEGGLIATKREDWAQRCRLLRSHGMTTLSYDRARGHATSYDVVELGYNYRMDDIRASLLLAQLEKLDTILKKRAQLRKMYIEELSSIDELLIPFEHFHGESSNYIFPIVLKDNAPLSRDEFRERLRMKGIQTSVHYPLVHRFKIYHDPVHLPLTEAYGKRTVTLPLYSKMTESHIRYIGKAVREALLHS